MVFVFEQCHRTEGALSDRRAPDRLRHGQDVLLDLRGEAEHAHCLGHPGAGDPLSPGDVGLVGGLAGLQEGLPLDGLAEEFDHPGRPGLPGRLGLAPGRRDGAHDPVGGDPARQGADPSTGLRAGVAVFEGALRPECDLDGAFSVFGHDVAPVQSEVYNTEVDLRLRHHRAASNTVTSGSLLVRHPVVAAADWPAGPHLGS